MFNELYMTVGVSFMVNVKLVAHSHIRILKQVLKRRVQIQRRIWHLTTPARGGMEPRSPPHKAAGHISRRAAVTLRSKH